MYFKKMKTQFYIGNIYLLMQSLTPDPSPGERGEKKRINAPLSSGEGLGVRLLETRINKHIYQFYILPILFSGLLSGCAEKKVVKETLEAFKMTDTMEKTTTTASAQMFPLKNQLNFYGKITADNNKLIEVFPIVGGNVVKVNVELGDYVNKGQILAIIRSTEVADFEKQLSDAKNDLLVAKNNLKVTQELFEGKLNSEREVIEAKSQVEKSASQLNRMEETYKIYNIKAGSLYEVKAPISGFIIEKHINSDMLLRSDKTDNIFDIAQINEVWAIANVNESDINQVKLGEDASITTLSDPDKIHYGRVDKIFNIIDPETKAMKVRIILKNPTYLLKPEMRATIKLSYTEDKSMIAIPSDAVIFDKSKNYVMVFYDKNNIETRQVEVYRQVDNLTYISSGLKENEKVINHNQLLIYDAIND
jgi:membrane fusion protein, heavy metal efflux system